MKTDARDALPLARHLRLGEMVAVRVPSIGQGTARDLVRAREGNRGDPTAAPHRLSKLLWLDPTERGRARWVTRWKPALGAFAIFFEGRIS